VLENHCSANTKLALVIDDSIIQCKLLSVLLTEEGYHVVSAHDGARGVAMYIHYQPHLVLMDINMPVMNGYEAAKKIKSLSGNKLCPLIFITSLDTEQAFIDSIDAGGDGILVRPFSPKIFKAKIKSIQRIIDLYSQIKTLQQVQQKDAELAEELMAGVIESRNFGLDKISILKQPAELFSGDIQLTAQCPNGSLNVLLGDFTGHGLRSTIGAIPLSETFRAMTKKGFDILAIIEQINYQLYDLLPTDLFLATMFANISTFEKTAYVFNAGLPDGYVFDEQAHIKMKITSVHPPLGVIPELLDGANLQVVSVDSSDRLVFITDGIVEVSNDKGELFGEERFEQAAIEGLLKNELVGCVSQSIDDFCQGRVQDDDISLIDIPCDGWYRRLPNYIKVDVEPRDVMPDVYKLTKPDWHWYLHLEGKSLATVNPIPMIMNQINEIEGAGTHWQSLYTILTELFLNALDHGVLGLNSQLKDSTEGFAIYFNERDKSLKALASGFLTISLAYHSLGVGGKMVVNIKDSGKGFDSIKEIKKNSKAIKDGVSLTGRGIELVNQLCDTLEYKDNGTQVEATYLWHGHKN
jgi:two-component system, HptB-dependent secretion and biofilm response regulator